MRSPSGVIGSKSAAKRAAINEIWSRREVLFQECLAALAVGPEHALTWLQTLPWIGPITRYHLAKNVGIDCAKPDLWLQRVAEVCDEADIQAMCRRLSEESGLKARTVDLLIWRACANHIVIIEYGLLVPDDERRIFEWFEAWKAGSALSETGAAER